MVHYHGDMASLDQDHAAIGCRLRFGVFEFDRQTLELFRRGRRLRLPPQPAKALDLLLCRARRLVSRDELRNHIWGEGTHVDFDASLNRCIRQIRAALGDDATSSRFLETLPRRGYRFLAPVELVAAESEGAADGEAEINDPQTARPKKRRRGPRPWRKIAGSAALLAIVAALASLSYRPESDSPTYALSTTSEVARQAYLRGTYHLDRFRSGQESSPALAVRELELAVEVDPLLAPAYAELAWAKLFEGRLAEPEQARQLAETALELDAGQASAHLLLGRLAMVRDFDWPAAGRSLDRAAELAPGDASCHHAKAFYLSALGRHDAAIASIERALELDPASVVVRGDVATIYYRARRFELALDHYRVALELEPGYLPALRGRVLADLALGRQTEAVAGARALMAAAEADPAATVGLDAHDPARALEAFWRWYLEQVEAYLQSRAGAISTADLAFGHLALGQPEPALDALEIAGRRRDSPLLAALAVDPAFDLLHGHPRFEGLLEGLGLSGVRRGDG